MVLIAHEETCSTEPTNKEKFLSYLGKFLKYHILVGPRPRTLQSFALTATKAWQNPHEHFSIKF